VVGSLIEEAVSSPVFQSFAANERRELSCPRPSTEQKNKSPNHRDMSSLFLEAHPSTSLRSETLSPDEADYSVGRGRSMVRTSDIIEPRLSAISWIHEEQTEAVKQQSRRVISPPRPNFVNLATTPVDQRHRTLSPLRRNPLTLKRISISLPPLTREGPSLRQHPSMALLISDTLAPENTSRTLKSAQFSQTLAKFQDIATQNPGDAQRASNTVRERAIAGIYIPGSSREHAVRQLSRSRSRGKALQ
jgi:hypothetical protein